MSMWLRYLLYSKLKIYYSVVGSTLEWWHGAGGEWWHGAGGPHPERNPYCTHMATSHVRAPAAGSRKEGRRPSLLIFLSSVRSSCDHVPLALCLCLYSKRNTTSVLQLFSVHRTTLGSWDLVLDTRICSYTFLHNAQAGDDRCCVRGRSVPPRGALRVSSRK